MEPLSVAHSFVIICGIMGFCYCCDRWVCKPCVRKIKNNPNLFTPPTTPDSNNPPNSPASSIASEDPLPSPSTMKPDYSSSEDYIDIYIEYSNNMEQQED